jgi:Zn-dependent protease
MKWTLQLGRVYGTAIGLHLTFPLLLAYVAWDARSGGLDWTQTGWLVGLVCLLFVCVLLHEFGHILAARYYGIRTPQVTLMPIGGVAMLERMPKAPAQEFVVTLAGPLVNVLIAVCLTPFLSAEERWVLGADDLGGTLLGSLRWMNVAMCLFNLLPLFPMDGGRLLRALLHAVTKSYSKATRWAARFGQVGLVAMLATAYYWSWPVSPFLIALIVYLVMQGGWEAKHAARQEQLERSQR